LELRASASLSRLWADNGNVKEAHALLSGVYAWFTEGFDTADLSEAKSLLEELETRPDGRRAARRTRPSVPVERAPLREKAEQSPDRHGDQESA
jgi:hypothetical protein